MSDVGATTLSDNSMCRTGAFSRIVAAGYSTCGIHEEGDVQCWGALTARVADAGIRYVDLAADDRSLCVLTAWGEVECDGERVEGGPYHQVVVNEVLLLRSEDGTVQSVRRRGG